MFGRLGLFVSRNSLAILLFWVAALVTLLNCSPRVEDVTEAGEFNFLPDDAPTRLGQRIFEEAFPDDLLGSNIVVVLAKDNNEQLSETDLEFIEKTLKPRLQALIPAPPAEGEEVQEVATKPSSHGHGEEGELPSTFPEIKQIRTPGSREIGKLLVSGDRQAALVILDLTLDFMSAEVRPPVTAVENIMNDLQSQSLIPPNIQFAYSGSALVGRDTGVAQQVSAEAVEQWTLILIVGLLLAVYRAPLPVLVPLLTLGVSLAVAMRLLALATQAGWIGMFEGIQVYTVVVAYGAGVDFSMFLTSRYHEELQKCETVEEAISRTMAGVGPAVTAAAGTVIFGIGMMTFATFGKFHQAGISISFSLFVILLAALTFTPALLRIMGRYTFWPEMPMHGVEFREQKVGSFVQLVRKLTLQSESHVFWEKLAKKVTEKPIRLWFITVVIMFPFTIVGWYCYDHVSFGLIGELRKTSPCVVGTELISKHFAKGLTGPTTLVIQNKDVDFSSSAGQSLIRELTERLDAYGPDIHIQDIRSVIRPLGEHHEFAEAPRGTGVLGMIARRNAQRASSANHYLGGKDETGAHVTRLDLVLDGDPFSRESITKIEHLQNVLNKDMPDELKKGQSFLLGATASIRDLQVIAGADRVRINILVTLAVFVVLLLLIRSLADSLYLMVTVIFSYLCTLGITWGLFYFLDPENFGGLDWTVPTFLFTILVAVGQDYNIFLVERIHEERKHHGPLGSVRHAVVQTASIITSCGLIMAGTFSALLVGGQLARMNQLGFSLAFGVLLDTMVVRPILVPAYFAWRARRKLKAVEPVPSADLQEVT
ncbi:MMPL family transporter [Planctomicrobium sp. SH668]|uniref:MMPL family transporter n=1 Tax=Planctomicrobium sp. SH668 TaxID=3448126 RepID=UPI003F5B2963